MHQSHEYTNSISKAEEEKYPIIKQNFDAGSQDSSSSDNEEKEQAQSEIDQEDSDEDDEEEEFPVALNRLIFSFLPQEIAYALNDQSDWKKRTIAIQQTETLIK